MLICIFLFSKTTKSSEHIAPPPKSHQLLKDTMHYLDEAVTINVETESGPIQVVHYGYMSAKKRGIVLLLPDIQQPPLNSNGIGYLTHTLPDDGFDTYTMITPDFDFSAQDIVLTDDAFKNASYPVSQLALDNYKEKLLAYFDAVYATLKLRRDEQFVVVAFGTSAGIFAEYLATLPTIQLDAFISVSPQLPIAKRNKHLPAKLSQAAPALFNFYYSFDSPLVTQNMPEALRWVKRNNKYDFRQIELFGERNDPLQHQRLRKYLTGFLRSL